MNKLYNDCCFNVFDKIDNKSVNLVLVDLPYGQTACSWDHWLDLDKIWKSLKRIGKDNCQYIFFTTTKYGNKIIESNPNWFRYDIVWEKYSAVGF
jgi:DNA modification methylase